MTSNNIINNNNLLIIEDYVTPLDVPKILDWFNDNSIAEIKDITYHKHEEPEYYVEDKQIYGYVLIEIDKWYDNAYSNYIYNHLVSNGYYHFHNYYGISPWNTDIYNFKLEFYYKNPNINTNIDSNVNNSDNSDNKFDPNSPLPPPIVRQYATTSPLSSDVDEVDEAHHDEVDEVYEAHHDEVDEAHHDEVDEAHHDEVDEALHDEVDEVDETHHDEEDDDETDEDYNYVETHDVDDDKYEYLPVKIHNMVTRSKSKKIFNNDDNLTLKKSIVKKNKKFIVNTTWNRRLRSNIK